jgi:uncharacterized protein (TIGR02757 family)
MMNNIKAILDEQYTRVNTPAFIPDDPVQFPHRYHDGDGGREDVEIAAFLAAGVAWGNRAAILRSCEKMFSLCEDGPYNFVMREGWRALLPLCDTGRGPSIHRTFFLNDLIYYCKGLKRCFEKYNSLEALFAEGIHSETSQPQNGVWAAISLFRDTLAEGNDWQHSKHIADPRSRSACKRVNLALRWLTRREGPIDLGLWTTIDPACLLVPLDVHVGRIAREMGLLDPARKANDRKTVDDLTARLREFCPEDPIRYDLALFGVGVERGDK